MDKESVIAYAEANRSLYQLKLDSMMKGAPVEVNPSAVADLFTSIQFYTEVIAMADASN